MKLNDDQERSAEAGEYVLGTLTHDERAAFEQRLSQDRALRAEVYAWQDRLMTLSRRVRPLPVRKELLARLLAQVGARPHSAANDAWWHRAGPWRWLSGAGLAASVVLTSLLALSPSRTPEPIQYLAVLQSPAKDTGWLVEVSAGRAVRLIPVGALSPVPAGKSVQFWTKPEGAALPTSLGLVRSGERTALPVDRLPALGEHQLFELTLEPAEGSPIGRPTGPVLYVGKTVRL